MSINLDLLANGADARHDAISPSNGQTIFTLSLFPQDTNDVVFYVNNTPYTEGATGGGYFTVSGVTLTWANIFAIQSTDLIEIVYYPRYVQ